MKTRISMAMSSEKPVELANFEPLSRFGVLCRAEAEPRLDRRVDMIL